MVETDHDRIIRIQGRLDAVEATVKAVDEKLGDILTRGVARDKVLERVVSTVDEMLPSVRMLSEGLVFARWGRWLVGGGVIALSYTSGAWDWALAHFSRR